MRNRTAFFLVVGALGLAFGGAPRASAASTTPLSYGGRLVGADGAPLAGTVQLSATFHSDATAGTLLGTAPAVTVTLTDGIFSADFQLADDELHAIFSAPSDPVWIEIKDEASGKTWARQRFNVVPYALKVPVDDNTLNYNDDGRLQLKIAESGLDGELLTSDGNGGFKWSTGGAGGAEPAITAGTSSQYWRGDKTWQTLSTTVVAEGTNQYFTEARAKSAAVADSLAGGATDVAPSQAAVATGLAGKEGTLAAGNSSQYYRGDKSWRALDTTAVAENGNLYFTDARARSATVAQTVTDGVTASSPSQDAVFDALAGKEPTFAAGTTAQYLRGNKVWTTLDTAVVPENGNLYYTDARARAGTVAQTITNGTTTTAPSQDAVFDALAFKEPAFAAGTAAQFLRGDKTWQVLNTNDVSEGANLYYTDSRAKAASVANAINDGTNDVAPSQNAVFDGLALKESLVNKNANDGYAGLDSNGLVPANRLPFGGLTFKGSWNAGSDTPDLDSLPNCGTIGEYYIVSVGGATSLSGITTWSVGDWAICSLAGAWTRVANTAGGGAITTLNGLTGTTVNIHTGHIPENTNLYFTDGRAKAAAVANSLNNGTTDVAPSQDAVFDALAAKEAAFAAASTNDYFRGDKTWQPLTSSIVPEGTNLYFNDGRAQAAAVAQTITNGVTATAPSQDAVFDALATKEGSLAGGTTAQFYRGDKSWQTLDTAVVPENGNLYYTDARAQAGVVAQTVANGITATAPSQDAVYDLVAGKANASHAHSSLDAADGNPSSALLVDNAGFVGIGSSAPGVPLDVNGQIDSYDANARIRIAPAAFGANMPGIRTTTDDPLHFGTNGVNRMTVANTGEVGIGTSAPAQQFEVSASQNGKTQAKITNINAGASASAGALFGTSSGENGYVGANGGAASSALGGVNALQVTNLMAAPLVLATNSSERMRIDSAGNVGIGTTAPSGKLHVVRAAAEYGAVATFRGEDFHASDPATRVQIQDATGGVAWFMSAMNDGKFALHQGSTGDRITVDNATGNVGLGTGTPTAKLHVGGVAGTDGIRFPDGTLQTTAGGLPVGAVQMFAQTSAPAGYLACDGSAVSRTTYSALFAAIGTTYGAGDGSTTFNLPRAKVPPLNALPTGYRYYRLRLLSAAPGNPRHLIRELRFFWNNQWQRNAMTAAATGTIGGYAATVSSASQYGGYAAWQAFTNHGNDYYETDNYYSGTAPYDETSAQWIKVDFGAGNTPVITGYQLYSEWGTGQRSGDKMQLEGSADNSAWTVIPGSLIEAEDAWTITHFFDSQLGIYGIKY